MNLRVRMFVKRAVRQHFQAIFTLYWTAFCADVKSYPVWYEQKQIEFDRLGERTPD